MTLRIIIEDHVPEKPTMVLARIDVAKSDVGIMTHCYEYSAEFPETGARHRERVQGNWGDQGWLPLVQRVLMGVAFRFGLPPRPNPGTSTSSWPYKTVSPAQCACCGCDIPRPHCVGCVAKVMQADGDGAPSGGKPEEP